MSKIDASAAQARHLPKFVGYGEVQESLGVSRRTIERMVRDGDFPRPLQLAPNRVGWQIETLTKWLDDRSKGLADRAVADPNALKPEQLAEVAVDLLVRAVQHEVGEPIDPAGLRVTYAPIFIGSAVKTASQQS
jgi:prophage regulatory protein